MDFGHQAGIGVPVFDAGCRTADRQGNQDQPESRAFELGQYFFQNCFVRKLWVMYVAIPADILKILMKNVQMYSYFDSFLLGFTDG